MAGRFGSVWMDLLLVSVTMMMLQPQEVSTDGDDFKKEILKACHTFTSNDHGRCDKFWEKFQSAFVKKDPTAVGPEAYSDLIKAEPIKVEKNKLLLWSKTKNLITWMGKQKNPHFFTIGDTIYNILNDKTWCGVKNKADILTKGCPDYGTPLNPVKSYWRSVSAAFAKAAEGTVTVLLDGSLSEPYQSQSIFATDELPNLGQKVTSLHVLLAQKKLVTTICENASVKNLKKSWGNRDYDCAALLYVKITHPEDWWNTALKL